MNTFVVKYFENSQACFGCSECKWDKLDKFPFPFISFTLGNTVRLPAF